MSPNETILAVYKIIVAGPKINYLNMNYNCCHNKMKINCKKGN